MIDPSERSSRFGPGLRWLIWFLYLVAWTTALLFPDPGRIANAVLPAANSWSTFKLAHMSGFALLTGLSGWLGVPRPRRWLLLAFVSAHAMVTEYCQHFVESRHPAWGDVGFNHLGIALGLLLTWKWWLRP